jgi:hypothetical protein
MKKILGIFFAVTVFLAQNSLALEPFTPICRILKKSWYRTTTAKEVKLREYQGEIKEKKSYKLYNSDALISRKTQYEVRVSPETIFRINSACEKKLRRKRTKIFSIVGKDRNGNFLHVYSEVEGQKLQTLTPEVIEQILWWTNITNPSYS